MNDRFASLSSRQILRPNSTWTFLALLMMLIVRPAQGEDWPGWRGPRGDGTSNDSIPTTWDGKSQHNIKWKVAIPGTGHSSPVVHGDYVFLSSCITGVDGPRAGKAKPAKETIQQLPAKRVLLCLDRRTGKTRWQQTVITGPLETKHRLNSHASSTPATDGKLIFVAFLKVDGRTVPAPNVGRPRPVTPGRVVMAAYTFTGDLVWRQEVGDFISAHGFSSNPLLYNDLVILNGDHDGKSYIVALDKQSGKLVWKVPRRYQTRSYVTPIVRKVNGRDLMVFSGSKCIVGLNPKTGQRVWSIDGPTEQFVASMVADADKFYMAAGFPTYHVMGIRGDGNGDVTNSHVVWHAKNAKCYVPSPVVVGKHLIVADDRGTANCFATDSGERLWQARMGKHYSASLITCRGLVYLLADDGVTKVIRPGPKVDVIAENSLGEYCFASPAIAHNCLFIRGEKHLYCIGETTDTK